MTGQGLVHRILHFDIDHYGNKLLPGSIVPRLPQPAAHFLGHRNTPPPPLPPTIQTVVGLVSAWLGIMAVCAISNFSPQLRHISTPILIPSLGAGAVLNYVQSNLPAAQPRATILGQVISAVAGVGVAKLFLLAPSDFDGLVWLSTPTAVAFAILLMRLTNTVHPPGGATAALAVSASTTRKLGWWLVLLMLIGTSTMVGVGLICNNIGRRWPEYWWTPEGLPVPRAEDKESSADESDSGSDSDDSSDLEKANMNDSQTTLHGRG